MMDYQAFRRQYEEQHPASVPRKREELPPYPRWLQAATLMMFLSAALLSGVHTIPVVHAGIPADVNPTVGFIAALGAFASVELAILLGAYAMIGGASVTVVGVLLLATVTALAANIYSVIQAYNVTSVDGDLGTLVVAVIIGVVAPGVAFMSGKLFVNMHRAQRGVSHRAEESYRQEAQAWDERIGRAWDAYRDSVRENVQSDVQSDRASGHGFSRTSNASEMVSEYLTNNPGEMDRSVRELAEYLGVGKSTVASVRREMQERHSNGTGRG